MILLFLSCGSKKSPSNTYKMWPTTSQKYEVSITYQGFFKGNGSVQAEVREQIQIKTDCVGTNTENNKQKLTCNIEIPAKYQDKVTVDIKDNQIKRLSLPNDDPYLYDSIYTAIGSILSPAIPSDCQVGQTYKVKKPLDLMRIPFLNGPSSHLHNYELYNCTPPQLSMKGKFTISAQSTENMSAPRFTFATTDTISLDQGGMITKRLYKQSLLTSTTTLAPNSVYQEISVERK